MLAFAQAPARAGMLDVEYDIWLAGLPIGVATMDAKIEADRYRLDLKAQLTGLAGVLTGGKGGATATGLLFGNRPVPLSFSAISSTTDATRTLRMALSGGNIQAVDIQPPLQDWDRPDRIPVAAGHKRGVIDPLSAILLPAVGRPGKEASVCNRSIPVFDGATRFNVVLAYAGTKTVSKTGTYEGPVAVCSIRYVPIAGHRPARSVTKFMQANREMEAWMAPVAGTHLFVPYRISVKTMAGTTVVEASRFKAGVSETASAASRAVKAGN